MPSTATDPFYSKIQNPFLQAGIVLSAVLLINIALVFMKTAGVEIEQRLPWTIAATFILFFSIGNSLASLLVTDDLKYWSRSIVCFIAVAILLSLMAYLFSSLGMREAGTFRWIYLVLTIGYLVFLSVANLLKIVVGLAEREEWNQPRIRRRKR